MDNSRIYVIPITLRISPTHEEDNYINFILNTHLNELISNYIDEIYKSNNTLTEDDFSKLNVIKQNIECAICMENKDIGIKLECEHIYCVECIKKWLTENKKTCPYCRKEVKIE